MKKFKKVSLGEAVGAPKSRRSVARGRSKPLEPAKAATRRKPAAKGSLAVRHPIPFKTRAGDDTLAVRHPGGPKARAVGATLAVRHPGRPKSRATGTTLAVRHPGRTKKRV